ncbi:MAG TPA: hypothetical protein VGM62_15740 [Chthoniobacterales bacterium]|jgi:hypothetical protein
MQDQDRGKNIIVRAFDGEAVPVRIWQIVDRVAFVMSEVEYEKRRVGERSLDPVGIPIADCFKYIIDNKEITEIPTGQPNPDWDRMTTIYT